MRAREASEVLLVSTRIRNEFLIFLEINETALVQPIHSVPIEAFPRANSVMKAKVKQGEYSIIDLVLVEFHSPPLAPNLSRRRLPRECVEWPISRDISQRCASALVPRTR